MWEIEVTNNFAAWYGGLDEDDFRRVNAAVERLEEYGPALGRPWVDSITGARHHNMKELRPRGEHLRILFIFDPRRAAILLVGGDKRDLWNEWYVETLPQADDLYDVYLEELRREGLL